MVFSGTVESDFMKLAVMPETLKREFVNFASTDFTSLRQSMIDYIKAVYPNDYQNFNEADLGMMLVELMAYIGSVMSQKADMLAHENFLATAKKRASVRKLLKLIGVNMKGPISSAADAQISLDTAVPGGRTLDLTPTQRVFSMTSPEDGGAVDFTMYRVKPGEGRIFTAANDGGLQLPISDSVGGAVQVWDNLVLLEGTLVSEEGSFVNSETVKTIKLDQFPVVEKSVEVVVVSNDSDTDGAYEQVDNLYFASGSASKIFQVDYDEDYRATISFGDGVVGANPDDGSSYFVTYRVGGGTRGNAREDAVNVRRVFSDSTGASYQSTVRNRDSATGGQQAESVEHAKRYGPLVFRRQDRLVTLEDYNTYANSFTGVNGAIGKANAATRKAFCSANIIDLFILSRATDTQFQKVSSALKLELLAEINKRKMLTDEVVLVDGLIRTLDLVVSVALNDNDYFRREELKGKISKKIQDHFNVANSEFGKDFNKAALLRDIFEVEEVLYATIDNVPDTIQSEPNEIIQLNNVVIQIKRL